MTVSTKIGFGHRVVGEIVVVGGSEDTLGTHQVDASLSGKILLALFYVPREFLEKASLVGVKGVVVPSMHWRDFDYFKNNADFSLLVLTKFGKLEISKDLAVKLGKLDGKEGKLDGEGKKLEV